jgi:enoyl-CoA hydratase/carnithine racemase
MNLAVEAADGVAQITLVRPEQQNRFTDELRLELTSAFREMGNRSDVRAVVLAAEGEVFSAGGDFELMQAMHDDPVLRSELIAGARTLVDALLDVSQPIIAALNGAAIGAGANLALACDLVVASPDVRIADPHVRVGLVAGEGGCVWWPQSIGMPRARRHLLTGDPIDGATAFAYGLVTDLVDEPEQVLAEARRLAQHIAALPPLAVQGTKRALNRVAQMRAAEILEFSLMLEEETLSSADLLEAVAAFKEQRAGRYSGR